MTRKVTACQPLANQNGLLLAFSGGSRPGICLWRKDSLTHRRVGSGAGFYFFPFDSFPQRQQPSQVSPGECL